MRTLLLIPALVLLTACGRPDDAPRLKSSEVLLQVSAIGRAEVAPDEARITVGVNSTAATASAASAANADTMNRVVAALAASGVTAADVQTRNLSLNRIEYGPQKGQYRAENLAEIRLRDVAKAGAAIAAATEAGGNVVAGPSLRVGDPDRADAPAYAAAYKAARARAETYADAADLKIARVLAIRDAGVTAPRPRYGDGYAVEEAAMGAVAQSVAAPPVSAGVDTRQVRVEVDFALRR